MEDRTVGLILPGTEKPFFLRGRIAEQTERLIGMGGDHHLIVSLRGVTTAFHHHTIIGTIESLHSRLQADRAGERPGKGFDITPTAADHRPPTRPVDKGEQTVIAEKEQKGSGRKGSNLAGRSRPYGGGHGFKIVFDHIGHEPVPDGPLFQGSQVMTRVKILVSLTAESADFQKEAIELWVEQVGSLRKEAVEIIAGIHQTGLQALEAE